MCEAKMIIRSSFFLLGILLGVTSWTLVCVDQKANTREVGATTLRSAEKLATPSSLTGWKRYPIEGVSSFSIVLPNEPQHRAVASSASTEPTHVYLSSDKSGVYGLGYLADLPAAAARSESTGQEFFFDTFIKAFALESQINSPHKIDKIEFQMSAQRKAEISGISGLEQDLTVGHFPGRVRMVRIGKEGFCVVAIWKQSAPPVEAASFFDSVMLVSEQKPGSSQ